MDARLPSVPITTEISPPDQLAETLIAAALRLSLRLTLKPFLHQACPVGLQRGVVRTLFCLMRSESRVNVKSTAIRSPAGPIPVESIVPADLPTPRHAILYLHGGAFCLGSPRSSRSITTRLAYMAGAKVLAPHYRRTPKHSFPAQINDGWTAYQQLLADGYPPERVALAGDSAGGILCLQLLLTLRSGHQPLPGAVVLMSPLADPSLTEQGSVLEEAGRDPIVRVSWARATIEWLKMPADSPLTEPLKQDLRGLPPMLVQVGEDEVLRDDAIRLAEVSTRAANHVELEIHRRRWHVFQAQAGLLSSATQALERQAAFLGRHLAS